MQHRTPEYYESYELITLITGPMFAGKSQELLNRLHRHEIVSHKVLIINHAKDDRIATNQGNAAGIISTHRPNSFSLRTATEMIVHNLSDIPESTIQEHHAIGVDEGQFFTDIEISIKWAFSGKHVYIAGLMATSEGELFGNLYKLIPYSIMHQLTAVCESCYKQYGVIVEAKLTKCLKKKTDKEMIGSDCYIPVCFKHWIDLK